MSWNDHCKHCWDHHTGLPLCEVVSWNIRLHGIKSVKYLSTSVWGSELKSFISIYHPSCYSLPLCEVVSWNKEILLWKSAFTRSTSVWGSELKFLCCQDCSCFVLSTSVWGSELKYWRKRWNMKQEKSLPQCEVVSWNYTLSRCSFSVKWSTSVWGSELNVFEGSMWYCRFNPMMGKSGPQTFRACCTYSRSVVPERITVLI